MKKILLIVLFAVSLLVMSNCDEQVQVEGQEKQLESDSYLERDENRDLEKSRQVEHGETSGEQLRR